MSDVNANIGISIDSSQALAELKILQRQIAEFHGSVAKSSAAAAAAQKSLQTNLVSSINAIGGFSAELRTVNTTAEAFTKSLENNKFSMREYFRYAGAATKTFGHIFKSEFDTIGNVAEERVKKLQTQYIKMGRDATGAMKAIAITPTSLDLTQTATQLQIAAQKQAIFNQLLKQGSTQLLNFGKNTQWAGRQLMVGFTLPLAAFGATAAKAFQQLETEVIKFRKVYGDLGTSSQETEAALKNIQSLADGYTKYGVEVAKTVGVASAAAAAGFKNADLIAQTDAATKLAILGQIDQQQALETTISLQNAFKTSSSELASTIDFLNAVENQTVTSLDDITTAIPKVAPVIQQLGGDVKDLAFFLTAMKEGGINASEGANALKSGLASLINPSKKANAMLSDMGININNIVNKNQGNLKATVVEFAKELDKLDPLSRARAIETMFGKFQFARISTLLSNVTQTGNQAARVLDLAGQSAADLASLTTKELGVTAESALVRFQGALAKLQSSLAPVGEVFMNAFIPVLDFISGLLDKFNGLGDGTKKFIAITVGVLGGLGPILLMTFGLLANGVANIIKLFATLRAGYQKLTGGSQDLGQQTQYLTMEQIDAAAAAHSLEQSHARLTQQFNVEAAAVRDLRTAYQQALAAGASFALNNPGMMRTPKKFANGGVVVSGPGGPKDDMVPANLSNGEVVLSVDTVNKNRGIVAGLLSNRKISIPGYASNPGSVVGSIAENFIGTRIGRSASGGEKAQVNIPGGYQLGHFAEPIEMTGAQLRASVANQSQGVRRAVDALIASVGGSLEAVFDVFTNQVTVQSKEFNQLLGEAGSGKTAPVSMFRSEAVGQAGAYNAPLIREMQKAGASTEEVESAVQQLAQEFESGISQLGDVATVTAEDVNRITQEAYERVAESNKAVRDAREALARPGAIKEKTGVTSGRVSFAGGYNTSTVKKEINEVVQEQAPGLYPTQQAFNFTGDAARKVGIQNARAIRLIFDQLDAEAKARIFKLVGDIDKMSQQVIVEAQNAGIDIGMYAVQGVAKGAETASDSKATARTAKDIINGLTKTLAAGEQHVAVVGGKIGTVAVRSIDNAVVKESAKRPRRVSQRPQGPAPIGPLAPEGVRLLPIVAPLTEQEKVAERYRNVKQRMTPKFNFSGAGLGGGMGLMAGSMALSALPEFTGKAAIQTAANFASMGAMFGPWGAAAGAAIGLVSAGLGILIDRQEKQKAMTEAAFKSSASVAKFFGNEVVNTDVKTINFNTTLTTTNSKLKDISGSAKDATTSVDAFKKMVDSLEENDPLRQLIDGLKNESNIKNVQNLATAFVTMQVATGQIKADQANALLNNILAASDHADLVGANFMNFASQADAVSSALDNLKVGMKAFSNDSVNTVDFIEDVSQANKLMGSTLVQLSASFSNVSSYTELQLALEAIKVSGLDATAALESMLAAYLAADNIGQANVVRTIMSIKGSDVSTVMAVQQAILRGIDVNIDDSTTLESLLAGIDSGYKKAGNSAFNSNKKGTEASEKQIASNKKQISQLEKKKNALEEILKKEQKIADAYKRQNDYLNKQQDLNQKIAEAKMSGNYLEAANLEQQLMQNTGEFNYDIRIAKITAEKEELDKKIAALQDNNTAIEDNTRELQNNQSKMSSLITALGKLKVTGEREKLSFTPPSAEDITDQGTTYIIAKSPTGKLVQVKTDADKAQQTYDMLIEKGFEVQPGYKKKGRNPDKVPVANVTADIAVQPPAGIKAMQHPLYSGQTFTANGGVAKKAETYKDGDLEYRTNGSVVNTKTRKIVGDWHGPPEGDYTGNKVIAYNTGGPVFGAGTATSDSIPAMLSNGEYVVKASAVKQYGTGFMDSINAGKFASGGKVSKDGWLQRWAKSISGQPAAEMFGTAPLLRLIAGIGGKGDKLGAAQVPASFLGMGIGSKIAGMGIGKAAFALPNKLYQIRNQAKVNSMIKSGMWHGSQPTGYMGEEYLQGTNILTGPESNDPYYGMGFFSTTSKNEANSYASGLNSFSNWGESMGSLNRVVGAPRGKYVDFTRGTKSLKWQDYSLAKALGAKGNRSVSAFMPENLGDIMNSEGMTGLIMKRMSMGRSPLDRENPMWLSWSNPAGVITKEKYADGGYVASIMNNLPKFHDWNGPIPGPYGEELNAVVKSGTEGVYQEDYMNRLRKDADTNTSTSNSNTVYNIDMTINGGGANANEIANQVMAKIKTISNQNNKSNKVVI